VEARHLPGLYYLPSLSIAAVVYFGGKEVIGGHLSIGQFVLFETLLLQLVWPLEALGWITNLGQRALASAGRSFAWLEGIEPLPEPKEPRHLPRGPLGVRFEAVEFAYGGEAGVLRARGPRGRTVGQRAGGLRRRGCRRVRRRSPRRLRHADRRARDQPVRRAAAARRTRACARHRCTRRRARRPALRRRHAHRAPAR